ncbi:MAG: glycoside hydrolase family 31 protein [Anaerolineae bacterium]|nr:glycoside hydrolase family 31 protein [Anaerolineae bacterium]
MIQRILRRGQPPAHKAPVPQAAIEACESDLRTHERRPGGGTSALDWQTPGEVRRIEPTPCGARLICAYVSIDLIWLSADSLRVTAQRENGHSASVPPPRSQPVTAVACEMTDATDTVTLTTEAATCIVDKKAFKLSLGLPNRKPVYAELNGPSWQPGKRARLSVDLRRDDLVCGLGVRDTALDLRGQRVPLWNETGQGKTRYGAPVLLTVNPVVASSLVWLNPARGFVDVGAAHAQELRIESEDDRLDYVICAASSASTALARVAELFEPLTQPPMWALGYQHREAETTPSSADIEQIADGYRKRRLPCDVIHLGSSMMQDGRPFAIDTTRFPQAKRLVDKLHEAAFQVMIDLHPAILADESNPSFVNGQEQNVFVRYPDGELVRGAALPGVCAFPDFTRADVRTWWGEQMAPLVRLGIDGIVHQAAEPTIARASGDATLPDAAQHGEDRSIAHARVHNIYSAHMAAATQAALTQFSPLRNVNVMTSGWVGGNSLGFSWYDVDDDSWHGIRASLRAALNASLSGLPLIGVSHNVADEPPDGEIFTRWLQAVALLPGLSAGRPWIYEQPYALINRLTLELRYRLLPYLYACIAQAREYGGPVIRPLWMVDPADAQLAHVDDAYMVGEHVLVAPVTTPDTHQRQIYLPGGDWYDFWTHEPYQGRQMLTVPAPLERLPVFVRSGAALALWEPMQHVKEATTEHLTVRIYAGNGESAIYEDHGEGPAYHHGEYRWLYFSCAWESNTRFVVRFRVAGTNYFQTYPRMLIVIVGVEQEPVDVRLDRQGAPVWYYDQGRLELLTDGHFNRIEVEFKPDPHDTTLRRSNTQVP